MSLSDYTLADLGVFVGIVASSCALIMSALWKSKCKEISLCPPRCIRDPTIPSTPIPTDKGVRP